MLCLNQGVSLGKGIDAYDCIHEIMPDEWIKSLAFTNVPVHWLSAEKSIIWLGNICEPMLCSYVINLMVIIVTFLFQKCEWIMDGIVDWPNNVLWGTFISDKRNEHPPRIIPLIMQRLCKLIPACKAFYYSRFIKFMPLPSISSHMGKQSSVILMYDSL